MIRWLKRKLLGILSPSQVFMCSHPVVVCKSCGCRFGGPR